MRNHTRKKSKIMVNVVDVSSIEKYASEHIQKTDPRDDHLSMDIHYTWGYVKTPDGIYVLCNEGVGDNKPITADNKAEFHLNRSYHGGAFEMFPSMRVRLDDKEILELPVVDTIPLHKFIREFGSRLESNYHEWEQALNPVVGIKLDTH